MVASRFRTPMLPLTSAFSSVRDLAGGRRLRSPRSWGGPPAGAPVGLAVGTVVRFRAATEANGAFLLGGVTPGFPYSRPRMRIDPDCDRTSLSEGRRQRLGPKMRTRRRPPLVRLIEHRPHRRVRHESPITFHVKHWPTSKTDSSPPPSNRDIHADAWPMRVREVPSEWERRVCPARGSDEGT